MILDKSLLNYTWKEKIIDENIIRDLCQKKSITEIFSKILISRGVNEENYDFFLNPDISLVSHSNFSRWLCNAMLLMRVASIPI